MSSDPLTYWRERRMSGKYPLLSRLAQVYLAIPASSVYSERLFSEAGNIYEAKRSRLLPTRSEQMLFLHHNLPRMAHGKKVVEEIREQEEEQ